MTRTHRVAAGVVLAVAVAGVSGPTRTAAQATDPFGPLIAEIESLVGNILPGGVGSLSALGLTLPGLSTSLLSGPLDSVLTFFSPILNTPVGAAVLGGLVSSLDGGFSTPSAPVLNLTLSDIIPPLCQSAVTGVFNSRSDCGPLMHLYQSNGARQNATAVEQACSPAYAGCLSAVQSTVNDPSNGCYAGIDAGMPNMTSMNIDYSAFLVDALCVQDGQGDYCFPIWDNAITKLVDDKVAAFTDNATITQLCNVPCHEALANSLANNPNASAQANYSSILDAVCLQDPGTGAFCASELAQGVGASTIALDASKFCTPCARLEMAAGANFTNASISQYNTVVEDIEAYACATNSQGKLCSGVIANAIGNITSAVSVFGNSAVQQTCLFALLQGQCPAECKAPLTTITTSLGECGGLLLNANTLSYAENLPSPYGTIVSTIINSCQVTAEQVPAAELSISADLVFPGTSDASGLAAAVASALGVSASQVSTSNVNGAVAPVQPSASNGTAPISPAYLVGITITSNTLDVGRYAQRLQNLISEGTLMYNGVAAANTSTITLVGNGFNSSPAGQIGTRRIGKIFY